jgi:hypothetical protein
MLWGNANVWYFPISKKNNNYFFNKRNNIMDILNKVAELRAELKEQIATLIRQIYVETYGDFPDFEDRESYYLDFYDIPVEMNRMKICTLSIDIYQYIDESNSCEKQKYWVCVKKKSSQTQSDCFVFNLTSPRETQSLSQYRSREECPYPVLRLP